MNGLVEYQNENSEKENYIKCNEKIARNRKKGLGSKLLLKTMIFKKRL